MNTEDIQEILEFGYALYTQESEIVFEVQPIGNDLYYVKNCAGIRYWNEPFKYMNDKEIKKFKGNHNLFKEEELKNQMSIFDM